jgi:hypothetical protein
MTLKNWRPSCLHRRLDGFAPGHKALEWWLPHQFHLHWSHPRMCRFTSFKEVEFGAWHNELAWAVCRGGPSLAVPSSSFWFAVCRGPAHPSTPTYFPYESHKMHSFTPRIVGLDGLHALLPYPPLSAALVDVLSPSLELWYFHRWGTVCCVISLVWQSTRLGNLFASTSLLRYRRAFYQF